MVAADDKTDEPATDNTAKTAATDNVNQVGSGNTDGAFEPGPSSPFRPDGSLKWNPVAAAGRHWEATINAERAERAKRMWWPPPQEDE